MRYVIQYPKAVAVAVLPAVAVFSLYPPGELAE